MVGRGTTKRAYKSSPRSKLFLAKSLSKVQASPQVCIEAGTSGDNATSFWLKVRNSFWVRLCVHRYGESAAEGLRLACGEIAQRDNNGNASA